MPLPTFIIGGGPKCGSTSLYSYLKPHPEVFLSEVKEPLFFREPDYSQRGLEWYESLFAGSEGYKAVGEASAWYLRSGDSPKLIHRHLPDVRLIFVLRNPIERLYSDFWYLKMRGEFDPKGTLREFIDCNYLAGVQSGLYADHLERFLEYFPREQMLLLLFEDLTKKQQETLRQVHRFIGVDENPPLAKEVLEDRFNVTKYPRHYRLQRMAASVYRPVDRAMTAVAPGPYKTVQKGLRTLNDKLFYKGKDHKPPPMPEAIRAELRERFQDSNERLSRILNQDLSHWT